MFFPKNSIYHMNAGKYSEKRKYFQSFDLKTHSVSAENEPILNEPRKRMKLTFTNMTGHVF